MHFVYTLQGYCRKIPAPVLFYLLWGLSAFGQAACMELWHDEAYYHVYASRPAWGYFDHPPLTAWLIRAGTRLLPGEAGVRLFMIFCMTGSAFLAEKLIAPRDRRLFYTLLASVAFLQIGGMLAVPDTPMLFFSILFLSVLKRYIEKDTWPHALFTALTAALLLYSKYQGILLLLPALFSRETLLKRKSFWVLLAAFFLLMLPHLLWQWERGFPSLMYHFFQREQGTYRISYTVNFLLTQPFVFGPFAGFWFLYVVFTYRGSTPFERILHLSACITGLFLLLLTFRGRVEANWSFIAFFPLLYMGYREAEKQKKVAIWLYRLFPFTILLILVIRVYMVWDFLPERWGINAEWHHNKSWADELTAVSEDCPVAFMNSYQLAAKYAFYSGRPAFALNNIMGRENEYSLQDTEFRFQGQRVMLVVNYPENNFARVSTRRGTYTYTFVPGLRSYGNIAIRSPLRELRGRASSDVRLPLQLFCTNENTRTFPADSSTYAPYIGYAIFKEKEKREEESSGVALRTVLQQKGGSCEISVRLPSEAGIYTLYPGIRCGWMPLAGKGEKIRVVVTEPW